MTQDGGKNWTLGTSAPIPVAIYGLAYAGESNHSSGDDDHDCDGHEGHSSAIVVATAPTGSAWSPDEGDTWNLLPDVTGYWAVAFADSQRGWMVGVDGTILRLDF